MKTILLAAGLVGLALSTHAQKPSLRALDEKNGFRDVQFGSDSSALTGRVLETHKANTYTYSRPADNKQIGSASVRFISYTYYKGRLSTVAIMAKGAANARALKDALEAQYQYGIPENQYSKHYYWQTKRVKMSYEINPVTDDGVLYIFGREVIEQQRKDEQAAARKADL